MERVQLFERVALHCLACVMSVTSTSQWCLSQTLHGNTLALGLQSSPHISIDCSKISTQSEQLCKSYRTHRTSSNHDYVPWDILSTNLCPDCAKLSLDSEPLGNRAALISNFATHLAMLENSQWESTNGQFALYMPKLMVLWESLPRLELSQLLASDLTERPSCVINSYHFTTPAAFWYPSYNPGIHCRFYGVEIQRCRYA